MKFGEQLQQHIQTSSTFSEDVYVNYNDLKERIRRRCQRHRAHCILETAGFKRRLRKAIATVNSFYSRMEADLLKNGAATSACPQLAAQVIDLKQYAMLNYVAVLKLLKKHDKYCGTELYPVIEKILRLQPFVVALLGSPLFYGPAATLGLPAAAGAGTSGTTSAEDDAAPITCGICLEPRAQLQRLTCHHEFCMLCLAKAAAAELHACPVCRSPQPLHPIDIALHQLNISLKYSPRPCTPTCEETVTTSAAAASPGRRGKGKGKSAATLHRPTGDERSITTVAESEDRGTAALEPSGTRASAMVVRSVCDVPAVDVNVLGHEASKSCATAQRRELAARAAISLCAVVIALVMFFLWGNSVSEHPDMDDMAACTVNATLSELVHGGAGAAAIPMAAYSDKSSVSVFSPAL